MGAKIQIITTAFSQLPESDLNLLTFTDTVFSKHSVKTNTNRDLELNSSPVSINMS